MDAEKTSQQSEEAPPSYDEVVDGRRLRRTNDEKFSSQNASAIGGSSKQTLSSAPIIPIGPLTFKVISREPFLQNRTITVKPLQEIGNVDHWKMRFSGQHDATLSRMAPYPQENFPVRHLADIKYCGELHHPYSILIKFRPSEAEIEKHGLRHVSDTDRLMVVDGYLTTTYAVDPPLTVGLEGRVEWKVLPVERRPEQITGTNEKISLASATPAESSKPPWTPFSTQSLVVERSDKVLATFTHAAPFAKETGTLVIPQDSGAVTPESVETIVILCATMVGFQGKTGLTSLLVESGYEYLAMKGKNKA